MDTKELITRTATTLFNQYGTAKVSTNLIAEKAGISSGNLYYHFKSKKHIIRAIYEEMINSWEKPYYREKERSFSNESLKLFILENFELLWDYRFFYRETVTLLISDPILSERYKKITKDRFEQQRNILLKAKNDGNLQMLRTDENLDTFLTVVWIVANNYITYLESMGQTVTYQDFEKGSELIITILKSYLMTSNLIFESFT